MKQFLILLAIFTCGTYSCSNQTPEERADDLIMQAMNVVVADINSLEIVQSNNLDSVFSKLEYDSIYISLMKEVSFCTDTLKIYGKRIEEIADDISIYTNYLSPEKTKEARSLSAKSKTLITKSKLFAKELQEFSKNYKSKYTGDWGKTIRFRVKHNGEYEMNDMRFIFNNDVTKMTGIEHLAEKELIRVEFPIPTKE